MSCCEKKSDMDECKCGDNCTCDPCVPSSGCCGQSKSIKQKSVTDQCKCGDNCTCDPCRCGEQSQQDQCMCGDQCYCNPCIPGSGCCGLNRKSVKVQCICGDRCYCNPCIPGSSCCGVQRAEVGSPAPLFKLEAVMPGGQFGEVSLADYKGKWVVLFFYPLDFTFVCPTEICAFSDAAAEFQEMNCEVIACSVDSKFSHLAWTQKPRQQGGLGPMNIPLMSDMTKSCARSYGVLMKEGIALRGLFLIDPKGVVRQITINDLPVGRDVGEVKRLLSAFQFTDEHGEVCPAGWRKGLKSMKADPEGSQEYFKDLSDEGTRT